ncbi:MAG: hypothetical protein PHD95_06105 [Candidatus ainarchaeum sp.]|nr:hypothetical protein [Candidatus ainarchaeum sp.]
MLRPFFEKESPGKERLASQVYPLANPNRQLFVLLNGFLRLSGFERLFLEKKLKAHLARREKEAFSLFWQEKCLSKVQVSFLWKPFKI